MKIDKDIIREEGLEAFGVFLSFYDAQVVSNEDPENKLRLRVKCPAIYGEEEVWAKPRNVNAGKGFGMFMLPEKGQAVRITCQGGRPEYPFWEYCDLEQKKPGELQSKSYLLKSPQGDYIRVGSEKITLKNKNGFTVTLDTDGISILKGSVSLKAILSDLTDLLQTLKVMTPSGQGVIDPTEIPKITAIVSKINQLLK
jgi:hypothetical protein